MKKIIIAALAVVAMAGCTKEDIVTEAAAGGDVSFSTSTMLTRTSITDNATSWSDNDYIGISSNSNDSNVKYEAAVGNGGTTFSYADEELTKPKLTLPRSGSVTYSAYYPYQTGSEYVSNVADQTNASAIDFLVAEGATGSEENPNVSFTFEHKLAMISISVSMIGDEADVASNEVISATLSDVATVANFSNTTGVYSSTTTASGTIDLALNEAKTVVSAIINPIAFTDATLSFELTNGNTYTTAISLTPECGKIYKYTLSLGYEDIEFSASNIAIWNTGDDIAFSDLVDIVDLYYNSDGIYEIKSAKGLHAFADLVNGSGENSAGAIVEGDGAASFNSTKNIDIDGKLVADIDLSDLTTELTPMGGDIDKYTGTFDGQGHSIYDMTMVNKPTGFSKNSWKGLFSCSAGTIKDVNIVDCTISGADRLSAIASHNLGTISGCSASGTITGTGTEDSNGTAGLVARNNGGTIYNCSSSVNVSGVYMVGGIVGYLDLGDVINCYNTGSINGFKAYGGLVGHADNDTLLENSYNLGDVSDRESDTASSRAGGVIGYHSESSIISNCYSSATVSSDDSSTTGGVIGKGKSETGVTDCFYNVDLYETASVVDTITSYSEENMTNGTLKDALNDNAVEYNDGITSTEIPACQWLDGTDGFPTLDFTTAATASN